MKQVIMLALILLSLVSFPEAQITNPKQSKTVAKGDTIKRMSLKQETIHTRAPAPLPDLKLSTLSFSLVSSQVVEGVTSHTFQINYTVKNEGTLAIAANTVFLQGLISYTGTSPRTIPGCGSVATSLNGVMINAGSSYSGSFRCTASFDKNNPPLYRLYIDSDNQIKELNEENNAAQMTILL